MIRTAFTIIAIALAALLSACSGTKYSHVANDLRAPSYPLVTIDPYTSAWSPSNELTGSTVQHWTLRDYPLVGAIKVDGKIYRFMGSPLGEHMPISGVAVDDDCENSYTYERPAEGWHLANFDDSQWAKGSGAFGYRYYDGRVRTKWRGNHEEIWVRRSVNLSKDEAQKKVFLKYSAEEDAAIFINGTEFAKVSGGKGEEHSKEIPAKLLKEGRNIISAYAKDKDKKRLIDFGLYCEREEADPFVETATQISADVQATRTIYTFECAGVELEVVFAAPMFMDDLDLLSRPVNYISYTVTPLDAQPHDVEVYIEASSAWAMESPKSKAKLSSYSKDGLAFLKAGSVSQKILGRSGDNVLIDWGYFYLASEESKTASYAYGAPHLLRQSFAKGENLSTSKGEGMAVVSNLGKVHYKKGGKVLLGYDDIYSVQYFGENLRPYWNRNGDKTIEEIFVLANNQYSSLMEKCDKFDAELMHEARKAGGKEYAELCALAYRQAISAHKLLQTSDGELLFLSKENGSNGSIGTVDVSYPSIPLFLLYNTELAKGLMNHIFYYSESGKWKKPFPAHDIGTYPLANGQTYSQDMPVEEAGNMLVMAAAVSVVEGNVDYAKKHKDIMKIWADYLMNHGLDPADQLCTDDFAGRLARNANLSIKAIMGVASYGYMLDKMGESQEAAKYTDAARKMAQEWQTLADDGDHYVLAFGNSGTWSQKYNIVWDKVLGFGIFSPEIAEKELKYYESKQNEYGIPLDNRETYTKSDWIIWTATLSNSNSTFAKFVEPIHKFMGETVDRVPMTDWYFTDSKHYREFRARSVVGGYFMKILHERLKKKNSPKKQSSSKKL